MCSQSAANYYLHCLPVDWKWQDRQDNRGQWAINMLVTILWLWWWCYSAVVVGGSSKAKSLVGIRQFVNKGDGEGVWFRPISKVFR